MWLPEGGARMEDVMVLSARSLLSKGNELKLIAEAVNSG